MFFSSANARVRSVCVCVCARARVCVEAYWVCNYGPTMSKWLSARSTTVAPCLFLAIQIEKYLLHWNLSTGLFQVVNITQTDFAQFMTFGMASVNMIDVFPNVPFATFIVIVVAQGKSKRVSKLRMTR